MSPRTRFFSLFLLCSCLLHAQQRYFYIEVLQPAKVQLPASAGQVESLLVVNNTVAQPADFGHQDKVNDVSTGMSQIDLSDAARQCVFGMQTRLEQMQVYNEVGVLDKSQNTSSSFYKKKLLSSSHADSLARYFGVDALLVLNQLVLYDVQEVYLTDNQTYYAYLQAYCSSQWTLHLPGQPTPFSFALSDTLMWANEDWDVSVAISGLPQRQHALLDFARFAGEKAADALCPQWEKEERYIYLDKVPAMEKAFSSFTHQRWQEAFAEWQAVADDATQNYMTRAYAAADMAVCAELQGDYQLAIQSATQAILFFSKIYSLEAMQQQINLAAYRDTLTAYSSQKI